MDKIKVLIIDDSAVVRKVLTDILSSHQDIEVVGTAVDAIFAARKIENLQPDVITLDLNMPQMDGLTFLKEQMSTNPHPVIMISTETVEGGDKTIQALSLGAVDFITKPTYDAPGGIESIAEPLYEKVKMAAQVKNKLKLKKLPPHMREQAKGTTIIVKKPPHQVEKTTAEPKKEEKVIHKVVKARKPLTKDTIIAIGASTGGTEAIREILINLKPNIPGIVIVQHMPEKFTLAFANRLNELCAYEVKEAEDGDIVRPNRALIAPGNYHMLVKKKGDGTVFAEVRMAEKYNRHRPSVDVLFNSVARYMGANVLGILLTGMGKDGAEGLLKIKNTGAQTITQNEETCIVYGMPAAAVDLGAAEIIMPIYDIADFINKNTKI